MALTPSRAGRGRRARVVLTARCGQLLLLVQALLLIAQPAHPQAARLTSTDLVGQRVTLLAIDNETVRYINTNGAERSIAVGEVLRVEMLGPAGPVQDEPSEAGMAWLVDGQALAGAWGGIIDEETIRWVMTGGTVVELSLDDVLAVSITGRDRPGVRPEDDDVLGLVSGERLTGFVEAFGPSTVSFVIGDADDPVPLPLDRVTWMAIANEPVSLDNAEPGSAWVTLRDGSRLMVAGMAVGTEASDGRSVLTGSLQVAGAQPRIEFPLPRVASIQPAGGPLALVRLADLDYEVLGGGEVFGLPVPPDLDDRGRLKLHAPLTLGFDLPDGAQRLTLRATLDLGPEIASDRARLAGMVLIIRQGEQEVARQAIDTELPRVELNLPVAAGPLQIELDPGVNGPVLDRLRIDLAEVLVGQE